MKGTKTAAIINAYGPHWKTIKKNVDENGWINCNSDAPIFNPSIGVLDEHPVDFKFRPKSISGLENNNGWDTIDDDNTAAIKDDISYDLYDAENDEIIWGVKGIWFVLSLVGLPSITHIRLSNDKKPLYK